MVFCPRRLITSLKDLHVPPDLPRPIRKAKGWQPSARGRAAWQVHKMECRRGQRKRSPDPIWNTQSWWSGTSLCGWEVLEKSLLLISIVTGEVGHALTTRVSQRKGFWLDRWTHTHWKPHRPCLSSLRRSPQETRAWNWGQLIWLFLWYPCWMQVSTQVCQCHVQWTHPSDHGWTTLALWLCHRQTLAGAPLL